MTEEIALADNTDPVGAHTLKVIANAGKFNRWMYDTIRPYLAGDILEIGSGIGNISAFAVHDHSSITLSDINTGYQEHLRNKFRGQVKDVLSIDLQHPSFFDQYHSYKGSFDTIFLLNVIEHLADEKAAIDNCNYLLKKNGRLVVLAPAYSWLYCRFDKELGHYRRYTSRRLAAAFPGNEFTIIRRQYFNFPGIAGWFISGKLLRKKLIGSGEMSAFDKIVPLFKLADRIVFNKAGLSAIVIAEKK